MTSAMSSIRTVVSSLSPSSSSRCRIFSSSSTSTSTSSNVHKKNHHKSRGASFRLVHGESNKNLKQRLSRSTLSRTSGVRAFTKDKEEMTTSSPSSISSSAETVVAPVNGVEKKEYDIYRDSPLRYMGYANECGEAFAAWLPPFGVPATYGVAAVYVLADTFDKAIKANKEKGMKEGVIVGLDTVTWQMLASVFWPGSFIRVTVNLTNLLVSKLPADLSLDIGGLDAATIEKALPTAIGLMTIPFIVKPIDKTIDWAMEESVTKVLRGKCESPEDYVKAAGIVGACLAVPPTLFSFAGVIGDLAV